MESSQLHPEPLTRRPRRPAAWRKALLPGGLVIVALLAGAASWGAYVVTSRERLLGKVEASDGIIHVQDSILPPWVGDGVPEDTFRAMQPIIVLDGGHAEIDGSDVRAIAGMSRLRILTVNGVGDDALRRWRGLRELAGLHVSGRGISDAGVEHLLTIPTLKYLTLTGTSITDAGLARLAGHPNLRMVRIDDAPAVTDVGVGHLSWLPELLEVAVSRCPVTDAAVATLVQAPGLASLTVEYAPITDAALEHIKKAERLVYLNLRGTRITDAAIPKLAAMRNLHSIGVDETLISDVGHENLKMILEDTLMTDPAGNVTLDEFSRRVRPGKGTRFD